MFRAESILVSHRRFHNLCKNTRNGEGRHETYSLPPKALRGNNLRHMHNRCGPHASSGEPDALSQNLRRPVHVLQGVRQLCSSSPPTVPVVIGAEVRPPDVVVRPRRRAVGALDRPRLGEPACVAQVAAQRHHCRNDRQAPSLRSVPSSSRSGLLGFAQGWSYPTLAGLMEVVIPAARRRWPLPGNPSTC